MGICVVRLGSARGKGEGLRIDTVRRPPRGVPKAKFASENWYDVWLPELSPSEATVKLGQKAQSDADWQAFARRFGGFYLDVADLDEVYSAAREKTVLRHFRWQIGRAHV